MQDDSGAPMHMVDGKEWCVLGYTTAVSTLASTAKSSEPAEELDAVCPLVVVFTGRDAEGEVSRIEYIGPSAVDFKGRYSRLLSRNGIEQDGGDKMLDNEVWLDWATIQFRFYQHCATYTGSFCVFGPVLSSPAHGP
jgi:hypothetical protein